MPIKIYKTEACTPMDPILGFELEFKAPESSSPAKVNRIMKRCLELVKPKVLVKSNGLIKKKVIAPTIFTGQSNRFSEEVMITTEAVLGAKYNMATPDRNAYVADKYAVTSVADAFAKTCRDGGGIECAFAPSTLKYLQTEKDEYLTSVLTEFKLLGFTCKNNISGMHVHCGLASFPDGLAASLFIAMLELFPLTIREKLSERIAGHSYYNTTSTEVRLSGNQNESLKIYLGIMYNAYERALRRLTEDDPVNWIAPAAAITSGNSMSGGSYELFRKGYPTIEVRLFASALMKYKVYAKIEFIHAMVAYIRSLVVTEEAQAAAVELTIPRLGTLSNPMTRTKYNAYLDATIHRTPTVVWSRFVDFINSTANTENYLNFKKFLRTSKISV